MKSERISNKPLRILKYAGCMVGLVAGLVLFVAFLILLGCWLQNGSPGNSGSSSGRLRRDSVEFDYYLGVGYLPEAIILVECDPLPEDLWVEYDRHSPAPELPAELGTEAEVRWRAQNRDVPTNRAVDSYFRTGIVWCGDYVKVIIHSLPEEVIELNRQERLVAVILKQDEAYVGRWIEIVRIEDS